MKKDTRTYREYEEQAQCWHWLELHYPQVALVTFHNPSFACKPHIATILKECGRRAGVPDLIHLYPKNKYHGLMIEFKASKPDNSRVTVTQKIWIENLKNKGYCALVAVGFNEYKNAIINYMKE